MLPVYIFLRHKKIVLHKNLVFKQPTIHTTLFFLHIPVFLVIISDAYSKHFIKDMEKSMKKTWISSKEINIDFRNWLANRKKKYTRTDDDYFRDFHEYYQDFWKEFGSIQ